MKLCLNSLTLYYVCIMFTIYCIHDVDCASPATFSESDERSVSIDIDISEVSKGFTNWTPESSLKLINRNTNTTICEGSIFDRNRQLNCQLSFKQIRRGKNDLVMLIYNQNKKIEAKLDASFEIKDVLYATYLIKQQKFVFRSMVVPHVIVVVLALYFEISCRPFRHYVPKFFNNFISVFGGGGNKKGGGHDKKKAGIKDVKVMKVSPPRAKFSLPSAPSILKVVSKLIPPKNPPSKPVVIVKKSPPSKPVVIAKKSPPSKPVVIVKKSPPSKPVVIVKKSPPSKPVVIVKKRPPSKPVVIFKKSPPVPLKRTIPIKNPPPKQPIIIAKKSSRKMIAPKRTSLPPPKSTIKQTVSSNVKPEQPLIPLKPKSSSSSIVAKIDFKKLIAKCAAVLAVGLAAVFIATAAGARNTESSTSRRRRTRLAARRAAKMTKIINKKVVKYERPIAVDYSATENTSALRVLHNMIWSKGSRRK